MARKHGLASTYVQTGCRCRPCTDANTASVIARTERSAARLASDPALAEHGKVSTYRNWGCRCGSCTAANAVAGLEPSRRWRERQRAKKEAVQP